ncbi:MAG: hypothetical protein IJ623_03230 [Bacteroidales bacterium]|nr:hypothetical protein [Bacteroidales bacterium]
MEQKKLYSKPQTESMSLVAEGTLCISNQGLQNLQAEDHDFGFEEE